MLAYQKSHPDKFYYLTSRFFTYTEKGSSDENWMFLDEYKSTVEYEKWRRVAHEDSEIVALMDGFFPKWDALIVPDSRKGEVWNEVEEFRVVLR